MLCKKLIFISFAVWLGLIAGQYVNKLLTLTEKSPKTEYYEHRDNSNKDQETEQKHWKQTSAEALEPSRTKGE